MTIFINMIKDSDTYDKIYMASLAITFMLVFHIFFLMLIPIDNEYNNKGGINEV